MEPITDIITKDNDKNDKTNIHSFVSTDINKLKLK